MLLVPLQELLAVNQMELMSIMLCYNVMVSGSAWH